MSKKSRKRNKKILAAIGIGLGAAALASRKKRDAVISDGDKNDNANKTIVKKDTAKKSATGASELGLTTREKSTPVKTPTTIQDNKPEDTTPKKVRMTSANVQSGKIDAPYKGFNFGDGVAKRRAEEASFNAKVRKNNNPAVTGTTLPGMKSGGRVKGCGKALRGFGKAMKGKR